MDQLEHDEYKASQLRDNYCKTINQHVKNMEDTLRKIDETRCKPDLDLLEESKELLTTRESLFSKKLESFTLELRKYPVTVMKNWLEKFKVNVTMDPMTASNFVVISEDLKNVKHGDNCPEQPNCPEKFPYYFVFAEQSFGSGIYYWEVDVKEQPQWALGLATKSLRKKKITEHSAGYLYMLRCEKRGNKFYLVTRPGSVCQQMKDPVSIIGIYLDYTERTLLFYDAINASLIYGMHIMPLTKPVKPLFSPCPPMPETTVDYMKICPL